MNLLHIYPALAKVTPCPRLTLEQVTISGYPFYVFRNANVYLDSTELVVRFKHSEAHHYFVELQSDLLLACGQSTSDDAFRQRLETKAMFGPTAGLTPLEGLPKYLEDARVIAADTEAYGVNAKAGIEARRLERDQQNARIKAEREEHERTATAQRIAKNTIAFRAGESIPFSEFEELCDLHGIKMPIQTLGSARKNVSEVSSMSMCCAKGANPQGVFDAARELKQALSKARE